MGSIPRSPLTLSLLTVLGAVHADAWRHDKSVKNSLMTIL